LQQFAAGAVDAADAVFHHTGKKKGKKRRR